VHALVDRLAATPAAEPQLRSLIAELDRTMEFFRLEPRRTVREDDA